MSGGAVPAVDGPVEMAPTGVNRDELVESPRVSDTGAKRGELFDAVP